LLLEKRDVQFLSVPRSANCGTTKVKKDHLSMLKREQGSELFKDLGAVLERLWKFHQAMRFGRPMEDSEQNLTQMKVALAHTAQHAQIPVNLTAVVPGSQAAIDSRPA
jgi:hypothetical protein